MLRFLWLCHALIYLSKRRGLYFLANPKSMMWTWLAFFPNPIRKLSGLMSRWMKFLACMYSTLACSRLSKHSEGDPQNKSIQQRELQLLRMNALTDGFCIPLRVCVSSYVIFWYLLLERSGLLIIWSASISVVFRLNFRLQKLNKSSKDGPNRSITSGTSTHEQHIVATSWQSLDSADCIDFSQVCKICSSQPNVSCLES